jgi:hypothetical protein
LVLIDEIASHFFTVCFSSTTFSLASFAFRIASSSTLPAGRGSGCLRGGSCFGSAFSCSAGLTLALVTVAIFSFVRVF